MSSPDRAVAITGLGTVSAGGNSPAELWEAVASSRGLAEPHPALDGLPVDFACTAGGDWDSSLSKVERRRWPRAAALAVAAADQALADSGLADTELPYRTGISFGTGFGGSAMAEEQIQLLAEHGPTRVSPMVTPFIIPNSLPGLIASRYSIRGPNLCHATACAASAHAIGEGARLIANGECDLVIAGGAESMITPLTIASFWRVGALSARVEEPATSCRPFDATRDGFVIGEGSAILILERTDRALARGAQPYGYLAGYGRTADAYHPTDPIPDGSGVAACVGAALCDAGIDGAAIGYVNAHGTGTLANDTSEALGLMSAGLSDALVSSTKAVTGHLIGAAGAIEAIITVESVRRGQVPGSANLREVDPAIARTGIRLAANTSAVEGLRYGITNSFAIGGQCASLIVEAADERSQPNGRVRPG